MEFKYYTYEKNNQKCITAVCETCYGVIKGTSFCDPSDTYDEEFGKRLAELKCLKKFRGKDVARLKQEVESLEDVMKLFSERLRKESYQLAKAEASYQNMCLDIEELIK